MQGEAALHGQQIRELHSAKSCWARASVTVAMAVRLLAGLDPPHVDDGRAVQIASDEEWVLLLARSLEQFARLVKLWMRTPQMMQGVRSIELELKVAAWKLTQLDGEVLLWQQQRQNAA
jgi:hypothetical protein